MSNDPALTANELRLSIDVTVSGHTDSHYVAPMINDALQELTNRRDFRTGQLRPGRIVVHDLDHGAVRVTVDVNQLSLKQA